MNDDLIYTRADMEAAIKRALDAAACREFIGDAEICTIDPRIAADIRALDPAQFIEEEKG